jgi:hypothetical protein
MNIQEIALDYIKKMHSSGESSEACARGIAEAVEAELVKTKERGDDETYDVSAGSLRRLHDRCMTAEAEVRRLKEEVSDLRRANDQRTT